MGKLHELLATEPNKESAASNLVKQTIQTFKNKENLFSGKTRTLRMFGITEENRMEMAALEAKGSSSVLVSATVPESLNYMACIVADFYDVVCQKEMTNQMASAEVVVDGHTILPKVPATMLLGLETKLKALREVFESIPTMAPGKQWKEASEIGPYTYKTDPIKDIKTEKTVDYKVIPQPTDKFPSQHVAMESTKNVGEYTETNFTGLITSADKAKLIERLDTLLIAVKTARQRANNIEAATTKIGDDLMAYLLGPWFDRSKKNPEANI